MANIDREGAILYEDLAVSGFNREGIIVEIHAFYQ